MPLPSVISLGAAYKANSKLTLAVELNYVGWNTYDTLSFDYANNTTLLQDTKSARNYKNTLSYRAGAQYSVNPKFDVRIGLKYLMTPVPDGYVTPETPDASHLNYSAGFGYKICKHLVTDVSFTYESMNRTDTNKENNMSGTYKTNLFIPGISIAYNF